MQRPLFVKRVFPVACVVALFHLAGCAGGEPRPDQPLGLREQVRMGVQAHQSRDYAAAIDAFNKVIASADADGDIVATAWANLGAAYDADARYADALHALEKARELAPEKPQIHFNLGRVYTNLGQFENARKSYLKAGKLQPENSDIPYNLGILYEIYLNQPDQALTAYRHYVEMGGPEASRVKGWITAIEQRGSAK